MPEKSSKKPVIMCFSGLDSTGGAGIQADIEVCLSLGVHCCPVVTALTIQNTENAFSAAPVDAQFLLSQARTVLNDMPIAAFKVGLIASSSTVTALHTLFKDFADIPVIIDPILSAGGGHRFAEASLAQELCEFLIPHTHLLLPNIQEAEQLSPSSTSPQACGEVLTALGCNYVLMTGTDRTASPAHINHHLFHARKLRHVFECERLQGDYHGSGCTLAAAITCYLALGLETVTACSKGLAYTQGTLKAAQSLGKGQLIPDRSTPSNHP